MLVDFGVSVNGNECMRLGYEDERVDRTKVSVGRVQYGGDLRDDTGNESAGCCCRLPRNAMFSFRMIRTKDGYMDKCTIRPRRGQKMDVNPTSV